MKDDDDEEGTAQIKRGWQMREMKQRELTSDEKRGDKQVSEWHFLHEENKVMAASEKRQGAVTRIRV